MRLVVLGMFTMKSCRNLTADSDMSVYMVRLKSAEWISDYLILIGFTQICGHIPTLIESEK